MEYKSPNGYTVGSRCYSTLKAAASAIGRASSTVIGYAKQYNLSYQQALDAYVKSAAVTFTVRGMKYPSYQEALDAVPVPYSAANTWMTKQRKHGHTVTKQDALDHYVRQVDAERVPVAIVNGVKYYRAKEAIESVGWSWEAALKYRRSRACDWQTAIDLWLAESSGRGYRVGNTKYPTPEEAAKAIGVTMAEVNAYREGNRYTIQDALDDLYYKCRGVSDDIPLASLRRLTPTTRVYYYYRGTDGHQYYLCRCPVCNAVLLIKAADLLTFSHSDSYCEIHSPPVRKLH